jgi:mannose-6-phosphate isomerase-like protein (cupin superfamily)
MLEYFMSRRILLQLGSIFVPPSRSGAASAQAAQPAQPAPWAGAVLQAHEGEHLVAGRRRAPMRIKVDSTRAVGATMSMVMSEVSPGASIPIHLHRNEDELIFIHTGNGIVTLGDRQVSSSAGAVLYAPKGVWHGIENTGSDVITWCAIWSPPGFEQYFRETGVPPDVSGAGPSPAQIAESARKYGMVFKNPA